MIQIKGCQCSGTVDGTGVKYLETGMPGPAAPAATRREHMFLRSVIAAYKQPAQTGRRQSSSQVLSEVVDGSLALADADG